MLQGAIGPPEKVAELLRQLRERCLALLMREVAPEPDHLIGLVEKAYRKTVGAEAWFAHKRGVHADAEEQHGVGDFYAAVIARIEQAPQPDQADAGSVRRPPRSAPSRARTRYPNADQPDRRARADQTRDCA